MGCISGKEGVEVEGERPEKKPESNQAQSSPPPQQTQSQPTQNTTSNNTEGNQEEKDTKKVEEKNDDNNEDDEDGGLSIYEGIENDYDIEDVELGQGGTAIVKSGRDRATNEKVAVKIIDLAALESEATAGIDPMLPLKREISIMKRANHPHIIRLFKVYVDEEKFYIVMELMPGGEELFRRIEKNGEYTEKTASSIFRQLVSAVEYLHTYLGVAHRDLKPENVLVKGNDGNEIIKLADFGFAKHFKEEQMKTALGSPAYAAPELFTADSYDEAVDMWSLGVILYLLLSGTPSFFGDTIKELTDKIINADFDFEDSIWNSVSDEAKDVICKLLQKDPKKRLTAGELKENLWVQGMTAKTR